MPTRYGKRSKNKTLLKNPHKCQEKLHEWGRANQVEFEPKKETVSIVSRHDPFGPDFKLLGVVFDTSLTMESAVTKLCNTSMWRFKSILKLRKFYDAPELMTSYKARILSYVEHRTPALYHASTSLIDY